MHDIRLAIRALKATPVVSTVAVLSLALGIGVNAGIFSIVNSLLLRALPIHEPERLALVGDGNQTSPHWSNPIWEQVRDRRHLFDGAFAWASTEFNLAQGGEARMVNGIWASGGFFEVLGVPARAGRVFSSEDDRRGGGPDGPVAVLSHDFWLRHFGGLSDAIGAALTLGGVSFRVIGVTPPGFFGPEVGRNFDVVLPLGTEPLLQGTNSGLDLQGRFFLGMMIRRQHGQSLESATAALRAIQAEIREATSPGGPPAFMPDYLKSPFALTPASTGRSALRARYQQPLLLLLAVVGLVLLIACGNIANLLLARAAARRHEMSVRLALGASRLQLARPLVAESLTLATIGTLVGFLWSQWMSRLLVRQLSSQTGGVFLDLTPDWRVLGFTSAMALLTALLFGTAPAWRSTRAEPGESLKEQGRGPIEGGRLPITGVLVAAQVALSLVLVVAAGLFVRTFSELATLDLGFATERRLIVNVNAPMTRLKPEALTDLYDRAREAVASVPGVERAAWSDITPISGTARLNIVAVPADTSLPAGERITFVNVISPGWLATYRMTLLAGRDFDERDQQNSPRVALANVAFARKYFNGANPVGSRVQTDGTGDAYELVGLVGDAAYRTLRDPAPPTVYLPTKQRAAARPAAAITVLTSVQAPSQLTRNLAAAIERVSPDLVLQFRPLEAQVNSSLLQERLVAMLSGFFGALALLLAALGLYGVTSYAVNRQRREIGVRIALGAEPRRVTALVLRRVAVLVSVGIAAGGLLSWWATRFVGSGLLYGVDARDPVTFIASAGVMAVVGALAGWLPAHRAAQLDPGKVLREG
jgi:predicted permease